MEKNNSYNRRVVVTGMGAVTPIGNTLAEYWHGLKSGKNGIAPITHFDASRFKVRIAAEVKGFDPCLFMDRKEARRMDPYSQYAVAASAMAYADAGLNDENIGDRLRFGVMIGAGIGGLGTIEEQCVRLAQKGPDRIDPMYIPKAIGNIAAGNAAIKVGAHGVCASVVAACSTGANSIGEAYRYIKHGYADAMIAGGAEAPVTPTGVGGFAALTALAETDDCGRASIPFDKDRKGFVIGEGAGVLVLESLDRALARGAQIYCEIAGYGATCDAYHMTAPDPEGAYAAEAMRLAMREANAAPDKVGYINAHGTSTPLNDVMETRAIKLALGEYAKSVSISSTKSMTGHSLGAAGAIEAIACVMAIKDSFVPPTIGLQNEDPECDLDYTKGAGRARDIEYALSNSNGFGGHNTVLCFKKYA